MTVRVLDLFCGLGGSSVGAKQAGAEISCAVDAWPLATSNFSENFRNAKVITSSLSKYSNPENLGKVGPIDLIIASPECTNHTCARGNRERDEASRETANYVLRYIDHFRPRWLVLENVIHMKSWPGYGALIKELKSRFFVSEQTLSAHDFGVPQSRRRLFLVCDRASPPQPAQPSILNRPKPAQSVLDPKGAWNRTFLYTPRRALPTLKRAQRGIQALGEGKDFLIVYYGSDSAGGWQTLDRPLRTVTTVDRFGLIEWDHTDAPTLRMLQVPELTRAMGFPHDYRIFFGSRRERIKLLGNSVCPPVMSAIVETLLKPVSMGEIPPAAE